MPVNGLKKDDLQELIEKVGAKAPKGTKAVLEEVLRTALEKKPQLVELDKRLAKFAPGAKPRTRAAAAPPPAETKKEPLPSSVPATPVRTPAKVPAPIAVPTPSATLATSAYLATPPVSASSAKSPKKTVQSPTKALLPTESPASALSPFVEAVSGVREHMSQVKALNEFLLAIEFAYFLKLRLSGLVVPTTQWALRRDRDVLVRALPTAGVWLATIALPLIVAFFANFTKRPSIRRKKHAYVVDPLTFGLFRIVVATALRSTYQFGEHASLTGVSGFVSSLFAIYAALLQTQ